MIERDAYLNRIRPFFGNGLIKVLTGIRRSGKSVMLELIQIELARQGIKPPQLIKLNFEEMRNAGLCNAAALHLYITEQIAGIEGKAYLFLDEIQEVAEWERCVNSLRAEYDCDIYITGSNAKLLSGELATYLAGRYVAFSILPFSFKEFVELYAQTHPKVDIQEAFSRFIVFGGMPFLGELRYEQEPVQIYLHDLFNSIILKDIVKRNAIRDVDLLERIIRYIFANIGTTFSATSISKYFRSKKRIVAPETILNYINYCIDAHLVFRVRRQDLKGKRLLSVNEKYYVADHGIREAVIGGNMRDINLVLENIVFMELIRRGYQVTVGQSSEREVDFVCERKGQRLYIQVAYLLASEDTVTREFAALETIRDNYPKYVLSLDAFDFGRNGIMHRRITDFLLAEDWG